MGEGVHPLLCFRLAYCLMFPIPSYGTDLFTPTKGLLNKIELHWHEVQRWVTNCFRYTLVPILPLESCLSPLTVLLSHKRLMAALRLISALRPLTLSRPASAGPFACGSKLGHLTPIGPYAHARFLTSCHLTGKLRCSPPNAHSSPSRRTGSSHYSFTQGPFFCSLYQLYSPSCPPLSAQQ